MVIYMYGEIHDIPLHNFAHLLASNPMYRCAWHCVTDVHDARRRLALAEYDDHDDHEYDEDEGHGCGHGDDHDDDHDDDGAFCD